MAVDVTGILKVMLGRNWGPNRRTPERREVPNYGVAATLVGDVLNVVLTFQKDCDYCCMEWGCHLMLFDGQRWERLREIFTAQGVIVPSILKLRLTCIIEEGAYFFDFAKPDPKGEFEFAPVKALQYEVTTAETSDA